MELDGQRIIIYNNTNETVKDLCFYLPGTDIKCKVKKCKSGTHVSEHIFSQYKGNLIFFFEHDEERTFIFENIIGIPREEGIYGVDTEHKYTLEFYILKENDFNIIQKKNQ